MAAGAGRRLGMMGTRTRQARGPRETPHCGADRARRWGWRRTRSEPTRPAAIGPAEGTAGPRPSPSRGHGDGFFRQAFPFGITPRSIQSRRSGEELAPPGQKPRGGSGTVSASARRGLPLKRRSGPMPIAQCLAAPERLSVPEARWRRASAVGSHTIVSGVFRSWPKPPHAPA